MNDFSSFLFARPSLAEGAARILDFADLLSDYNSSLTPAQADDLALRADWRAIGDDVLFAITTDGGAYVEAESQPK